jgi:polar amino acid transport system substrate-binding protein
MKFSTFFLVYLMLLLVISGSAAYAVDVVVLGNESMPWNGIVDGKNSGIMVDILNEATKYGAPNFQFKLGLPWERAQQMVHEKNEAPTAIIPLTRTTAREKNYKWIAELIPSEMRLVSYGRPAPIKTIDEAKDLTIGIIRGHSAIPTLKQLGFTKIDDSAVDAKMNANKLLIKRFDTIVDAKLVYLYNWKKIGQNTKDLQEGPMIGDIAHIYIAGDLNFPDNIAKSIADAIEKMRKDGTIQKILDKWK